MTASTASSGDRSRRGRPPAPKLQPWTAHAVLNPSSPEDWQLSTFAPWPTYEGAMVPDQNYVRKNLADAVVESDGDAWADLAGTRDLVSFLVRVVTGSAPLTASTCRRSLVAGRRGSRDTTTSDYCDTWICEACAIQKVIPRLVRAYRLMKERATVTVLTVPVDKFDGDTFRRAVGRATDCDDPALPKGWTWGITCAVRANDTVVYAYTSARVTGSLAAFAEVVDSIDAFEHFRTIALALPGVLRVPSFLGQLSYRPPAAVVPSPSDYCFHGRIPNERRAAYETERDRIARRDHGESYAHLLEVAPALADQAAREAAQRVSAPLANVSAKRRI